MKKAMEVEIVSTQTIRPAPSDKHPECSTLSIFDQLMPASYIPIILFYSAATTGDDQISSASDRLKKSLSETLTQFFPLAGRITDNIRVDPAAGIEYTEARVGECLRDILSPPDLEAIGRLLPAVKNSFSTERLLVVRQSVFECGGMAIGICFSHKVVDAAALSSFLRTWSATARGGGGSSAAPYLSSASRFPPSDAFATAALPVYPEELNEFTSRRFVLSGSQVASLKAKSCSQSVPHPTRVEAVISLIWQCAMRSKLKINPYSSSSWSSRVWQSVNLRNRINPPLPDNTFGNLVGYYRASTEEEEKQTDLPNLVCMLRYAKEEYMRDYLKKLDLQVGDQSCSAVVSECFMQLATENFEENNDAGTYFFSSVCKLDLYGAADFGWGKPIWATLYMNSIYYVVLSDTRGDDEEEEGGIQVWLNLPKHQMDVFEKDPLLLSFATPNPSIVFHHS